MPQVLGIDGGGTRTRAVVVDDSGRLRAAAAGGSINLDDHPRERAEAELRALLERLRGSSDGTDSSDARGADARGTDAGGTDAAAGFDAAFLAVGGVLTAEDREAMRSLALTAGAAPEGAVDVHHDAFGALAGGLAGEPGIVVVCGTGSICFGRTRHGDEARCGDWGPLLGDEASGHWLGVEALRAVARAHDGRGAPTALTDAAFAWLGIAHADALLRRVYVTGLSRAEIASFAPEVLRLAGEGDAVAHAILARGCHALAQCVRVVRETLFDLVEELGRPVPTVLTGGLVAHAVYREALERAIGRTAPRTRLVEPRLPAALGAARVALRNAGVDVGAEVDEELTKAARGLPDGF